MKIFFQKKKKNLNENKEKLSVAPQLGVTESRYY